MASVSIPEPNVLRLQGEIDLHETPGVQAGLRQLLAGNPARVFIDLSRVTFIDSSGLAVLIEAMQQIQAYGGKLALFGLRGAVRNIFHIARLDQVFRIYPDQATAQAGLET